MGCPVIQILILFHTKLHHFPFPIFRVPLKSMSNFTAENSVHLVVIFWGINPLRSLKSLSRVSDPNCNARCDSVLLGYHYFITINFL